ncbi:hypothetical protein EV361DRAFT_954162 [Lentinula raphanica]|nr:hypothetical protein EV361DRAFT_954162 [Lentinula raphanica]
MADTLEQTLKSFGIEEKVIYVTCDNAAANTAMFNDLEDLLPNFMGKKAHIGSRVKGDFTCLKKQFAQLSDFSRFNYLAEKVLKQYLPKDDDCCRSEEWEAGKIPSHLIDYAALDPLAKVTHDTPPGTQVAVLVQKGGSVAAYGYIASLQPNTFHGVRVAVPTRSWVVVTIDSVLILSACAVLHCEKIIDATPSQTKAGSLTLAQLQSAATSFPFKIVSPIDLLVFDSNFGERAGCDTHIAPTTDEIPASDALTDISANDSSMSETYSESP